MRRGLGSAGVEVLRRLREARRRLAVVELVGARDQYGNRVRDVKWREVIQ